MKKLTIITVNLNNKSGLIKTIDSVLEQSFKDFEYVIVDGGSSDGSFDVIQAAEARFPGLIWRSEPDSGVFNAMNKGIHLSKGEYLLFLNSGDYLVNDSVLSHVLDELHDVDILLGIARVTKYGNVIWNAFPKTEYTLNDFYYGSIAHQASFIKRDLFVSYGDYREDLKFMSDWEFFLRTIILNQCSLLPLDVLICDYNFEGLSSDVKNRDVILHEKSKVFSDLGLSRIISDYSEREQWLSNHRPALWAWKNPILHRLISFLYKLSHKNV